MQTALITGASSGFGFEFAKIFAREGYRLVLVAKPDDEFPKAIRTLSQLFPETPIINAGFGTHGFFDDIDIARDHDMIRLNALTMYDLTRLFAHDMIVRDKGRILNVSSTSALQPTPLLSTYSATKAFIFQISMGFDYELRRKGSQVRILALCPPAARTGFMSAANMGKTILYRGFWSLDAPQVAEEGYRALMRGKRMHIPGPLIGFLMKFLNRIFPTSLKLWLVYDKTRNR
jgi:uncharacterized protein